MKINFYFPLCMLAFVFVSCRKDICTSCAPRQVSKLYGGRMIEGANAIIATEDNGYLFAGWTLSNDGDVSGNHGREDAWVVKIDCTGKIQWQKAIGGSSSDLASDVVRASDGGYVFAGLAYSNDGDVTGVKGSADVWVVKLDDSGNIVWQKTFGGTAYDNASAITVASDGGYVLFGSTESNNGDVSGHHGNFDTWALKIDRNGNKVWQRALGGSGFEVGADITASSDGGYIAVGSTSSTNGDVTGPVKGGEDAWVIKLDGNGNVIWQKRFGGTNTETLRSVEVNNDGTFVVAGITGSNDGDVIGKNPGTTNVGTNTSDAWIIKLTKTGGMIWQKTLGDNGIDYQGQSVAPLPGGGYAVTGSIIGNSKVPNGQALVARLSETGNEVWRRSVGGEDSEGFSSVVSVPNYGIALSGTSRSNQGDVSGNHGEQDAWVYVIRD